MFEKRHTQIVVVMFILVTFFSKSDQASLGPPDYESPWLPMEAQKSAQARVDVRHKLDEIPILVDVQVKAIDGPNKGFIFPAVGGVPRDDDQPEVYGGVTYIYNDRTITASAPVKNNAYTTGKAIYTDTADCYTEGHGRSYSGNIRETLDGDQCKDWTTYAAGSSYPTRAYVVDEHFPEGSIVSASNYCRAPDADSTPPWCFYNDTESWKWCNVAKCTGDGPYYTGVDRQSSDKVKVRFRAWRHSSIPPPDFYKTGIPIQTGSPNEDEVYVDEEHGLGSYPGLVVVRTKITDDSVNWMSDAVGANIVTMTHTLCRNRYVVHGYSKSHVRVWVSTRPKDFVYNGDDGYNINTKAKSGLLEIYVWNTHTLAPWVSKHSQLGPGVSGETPELDYDRMDVDIDQLYFAAWAESTSGPNAGFRFPGGGALAYVTMVTDSTCSYGGLVYGYSTSQLRVWRPTTISNGGLICISSLYGNGTNTQLSVNADIGVYVFRVLGAKKTPSTLGSFSWTPIEEKCVHTKNTNN